MQKEYILSAVGGNRPGVVAEVTEAIYTSGCNIENSSMTLFGNHFTLMIHIVIKNEDVLNILYHKCDSLQQEKELKIHLFPVGEEEFESSRQKMVEPHYEIKVRGVDKAGIVYRTSQLLASRNINILELNTSVDRSSKREFPLFTMRIVIAVPKELDGEGLRMDLEVLAEDLQESISLSRYSY